jgi:hypothetical protein
MIHQHQLSKLLIVTFFLFLWGCSAPTLTLRNDAVIPAGFNPPDQTVSLKCGNALEKSINDEMARINSTLNYNLNLTANVAGVGTVLGAVCGFVAGIIRPVDTKTFFGYCAGGFPSLSAVFAVVFLPAEKNDQNKVTLMAELNTSWENATLSFTNNSDAYKGLVNYRNTAAGLRASKNLTFGIPDLPTP